MNSEHAPRFSGSSLDNLLRTMFQSGSVMWNVRSANKYQALREIVYNAPVFTGLAGLDIGDFAQKVIDRERLQSTGLGHGVAVAHGRTVQVEQPVVALGVSHDGIDFDAVDGNPVHLVFVVANHPEDQIEYLRILSKLATLVRNEIFRSELLSCTCCSEVEQKLCDAMAALIPADAMEATA